MCHLEHLSHCRPWCVGGWWKRPSISRLCHAPSCVTSTYASCHGTNGTPSSVPSKTTHAARPKPSSAWRAHRTVVHSMACVCSKPPLNLADMQHIEPSALPGALRGYHDPGGHTCLPLLPVPVAPSHQTGPKNRLVTGAAITDGTPYAFSRCVIKPLSGTMGWPPSASHIVICRAVHRSPTAASFRTDGNHLWAQFVPPASARRHTTPSDQGSLRRHAPAARC